ncbi:hypothetical protein ACE1ET_00705 [Saccharicrinis sp. FJH62]|uniref:hypothetical protein n=1 Tax=Saccharicrinis sp. FJH62 TaxID=3344657 RepID=UPI0035D439A9
MYSKITVLLLIIFFFNFFESAGQKIKHKTTRDLFTIEQYSVDKKTKLKQGKYLKLNIETKDTLVSGYYVSGKRTGIWDYYGFVGEVYYSYDYDNDSIVYECDVLSHIDSFFIDVGDNVFDLQVVDRPAIVEGALVDLNTDILKILIIDPFESLTIKNDFIMAALTIDKKGDMVKVDLVKGLNEKLDKDILNSLNRIETKWLPAIKNNKSISSRVYVCIHFYHNGRTVFQQKNIVPMFNPYTIHINCYIN